MATDMKVSSESVNKLLNRKEIFVDVKHENAATPSRIELQQLVARLVGADPESTEIREVRSSVGSSSSRVRVYVWNEKKVGLHVKKAKQAAEKK